MNQKSIRFAQICMILAAVSFIPAVIIYFTSISKMFDIPLEEALKQSKNEKKPIFLMKPDLYNQRQKNFAKLINSDDELKKMLKDKFILAKVDKLDSSMTSDFGKFAELALTQIGIIIDWNSEMIGFVEYDKEAKKLIKELEIYSTVEHLKWESPENCQIRSMSNGKPVLIIVSNSVFDNIEIANICSKPEELNFINSNYNPSFISYKQSKSSNLLQNILQKNNIPTKDLDGQNTLIFVLDKDMILMKYGILNYTKKSKTFHEFMTNEITAVSYPSK